MGRTFRCYCVFIWFYKADTASSTRCYLSISRINNRRFSPHNKPSAWTMHSLKSTRSYSTLSHTGTQRFGANLCYSTTCSITCRNVRHLEWICNSYYCIEVLPGASAPNIEKVLALFVEILFEFDVRICNEHRIRASARCWNYLCLDRMMIPLGCIQQITVPFFEQYSEHSNVSRREC